MSNNHSSVSLLFVRTISVYSNTQGHNSIQVVNLKQLTGVINNTEESSITILCHSEITICNNPDIIRISSVDLFRESGGRPSQQNTQDLGVPLESRHYERSLL